MTVSFVDAPQGSFDARLRHVELPQSLRFSPLPVERPTLEVLARRATEVPRISRRTLVALALFALACVLLSLSGYV